MSETLVDRELLEKLERLALYWLRSHPGLLGGRLRSRLPGYGHEFLDHRNFYAGDDLRAVNWRAYLRFERFLLKTFELEPRVPIRLLLDTSASMRIGGKFDYARRLALALVYVALVKLDAVTVQPFASSLMKPLKVAGGRQYLHIAEGFMRLLPCEGQTNFRNVARDFLAHYPKPGLVIGMSDFLSDDNALQALQTLADFGNELLLVQIWSPEDRVADLAGSFELIDIESGQKRRVHLDNVSKEEFRSKVQAHSSELKRLCARNSGRFVDICTGTPIEQALFGPMRTVIGQA